MLRFQTSSHLCLGRKAINNNSDIHKDKGYRLKSQAQTCRLAGKIWVWKINRKQCLLLQKWLLQCPSARLSNVSQENRKKVQAAELYVAEIGNFKAAPINIFQQWIKRRCVIGKKSLVVTELLANYPQLCSSSELFSFFGFAAHNFSVLFHLISSVLFPSTASSCFQQKCSNKPTVLYLAGTKQQTDKDGDQLLNIVEHLAATEPHDFSLRCWWRLKQR